MNWSRGLDGVSSRVRQDEAGGWQAERRAQPLESGVRLGSVDTSVAKQTQANSEKRNDLKRRAFEDRPFSRQSCAASRESSAEGRKTMMTRLHGG